MSQREKVKEIGISRSNLSEILLKVFGNDSDKAIVSSFNNAMENIF